MASALDGITVLELSHSPAGAMAGMFLCDHGARVIRLLDSGAPAMRRGGYLVWDRGKVCRRLDLSQVTSAHPHAAAYERLIRSADVVLEDFPPSSDQQALVRPDWLAGLNPRLVHCSITAYGKHGPLKDEPAIDELVMARMGILETMPGYRPGPVHVVHPLPSVGAALFAVIGIAAALLAREKTGRGRTVETSLMAGIPAVSAESGGAEPGTAAFSDPPGRQRAVLQRLRLRRRQLGATGLRAPWLHPNRGEGHGHC